MKTIERKKLEAKMATVACSEIIDQIFGHMTDAVPWEARHVAVGRFLLRPFELTSRIEAVWLFWKENRVAEAIVRAAHLGRLHGDEPFTAEVIAEAALATVRGEETRLPWFVQFGPKKAGPTFAPPTRRFAA